MAEKLQLRSLGKKLHSSITDNSSAGTARQGGEDSNDATSSHNARSQKPPDVPAHKAIESGISAGFQLACAAGPLCQAPLWGVAFELAVGVAVADFDFTEESWRGLNLLEGSLGPISGQV